VNPTGIVRTILEAAPGALVVASLGTATSALRAASDDGPHLYMGGSMGTALAAALGVPDVFADVAKALGMATATARTYDEVAEHVTNLRRPAVLEVRYKDRAWPGPSPFVDAPVVRWRFEQAARAGEA
jgi:hypothetical protein